VSIIIHHRQNHVILNLWESNSNSYYKYHGLVMNYFPSNLVQMYKLLLVGSSLFVLQTIYCFSHNCFVVVSLSCAQTGNSHTEVVFLV